MTLMAVGAVYSRALAEGGVRHILTSANPAQLDAQLIIQNRPLGFPDYQKLKNDAESITSARLQPLLRDVQRFGRTQPDLSLARTADGPPSGSATVGRPFFLTEFENHSRLLEGRWPRPEPGRYGEALELEVAIGERTASTMGLQVGSTVSLIPFPTDPTERIVLVIVGLMEPIDPQEEYWISIPSYFSVQTYGERPLVPFYLPEAAFFDGLGANYPQLVGDFGWLLFLDTNVVTAATAGPTKDAVTGLETDINKRFPRSLVFTSLDNRLSDYQEELKLARVPLYLFIGLVVLVILYFLTLVMGLLTRYRADEASLLRSRGGSVLQVSSLLMAAEAVVALAAMVIGPFLAWAIVKYLLLDTINPVGPNQATVSVGLSGDMFLMGAIGGLLSLAVLAAHSVNRAHQGVVSSLNERARPPSVPFLQRYYVDLLVLAGLGLLWWQISSREGFISRDVTSRALEADPSLLFGPVMVLLAAAVLVLRFLPWLVRLATWLVSRISPAWALFSLTRLARDPLPHGSLVIILMLASALGVLGASFQTTLARSQKEQTLYQQGGDLVLKGSGFSPVVQQAIAGAPGVKAASPIIRDSVTLLDRLPGTSSKLVRIDPYALPQVSWFREDFAGKGLTQLLAPLRQAQPSLSPASQVPPLGVSIPAGTERIGLWIDVADVNLGSTRQILNLRARLLDQEGRPNSLLLGDLLHPPPLEEGDAAQEAAPEPRTSTENGLESNWVYLEAPLPTNERRPDRQFVLVSFLLSSGSFYRTPPGSIGLDDLTAWGPSLPAGGIVIEDYEGPGTWQALPIEAEQADTVEILPEAARTGTGGLRYSWRTPLIGVSRGAFLPAGTYPLPAIGSGVFNTGQVIRFKAGSQILAVSIRDVTDFFPTLNPSQQPFLLVAGETYLQHFKRLFRGTLEQPQEMWLTPDPSQNRQEVISSLVEHVPGVFSLQDRNALVKLADRNPLGGGCWNGLTILALGAITVAVVLTLAIHGMVAVRTGRVDLTVARALGFTNRQLLLSLALERVLVVSLGIGAGTAIGIWLGRWVLGFLDITAAGKTVIPPMQIGFQGWLVALVLACLAAAAAVALGLVALWARRLKVPEVLRTAQ